MLLCIQEYYLQGFEKPKYLDRRMTKMSSSLPPVWLEILTGKVFGHANLQLGCLGGNVSITKFPMLSSVFILGCFLKNVV